MANRTLTDTATISWDEATANQVKGNVVDGSITNAKLAAMAQATIKGRAAGAGTGDPVDLTPTEVAAIVDGFFLTPAEGDALFLTPAEGSAAYQPLDADLTELAALRSVAAIHAFNFQNYH